MIRKLIGTLLFILTFSLAHAQLKYAALTIDGIPIAGKEVNLQWTMGMNYYSVEGMKRSMVPIVGFVNEMGVARMGEMEERTSILDHWLNADIELGNGTYSDLPLDEAESTDWYKKDILYGEVILRKKARQYKDSLRYFRYPQLDLGGDSQRLDEINDYVTSKGYQPVTATMRFDDEMFNTIYVNAKIERDTTIIRYIGDVYLKYIKESIAYYESLSEVAFGKQIHHIFSLRCSDLNNDMLPFLIEILWKDGYRFEKLEEVLQRKEYTEHLPKKWSGGFYWDYFDGHEKLKALRANQPKVPSMIQALYRRQSY